MARRRKKLFGNEIVNISSEIENLAREAGTAEEKLIEIFSKGEKVSKKIAKEIKKQEQIILKHIKKIQKGIDDIIESNDELTESQKDQLKILITARKIYLDKWEALDRINEAQKEHISLSNKLGNLSSLVGGKVGGLTGKLGGLVGILKDANIYVLASVSAYKMMAFAIEGVIKLYDNWLDIQQKATTQMSQIAMQTGATSDQFLQMRNVVDELAPELSLLTDELTGYQMAGQWVNEIASSLRDMSNFSYGLVRSIGRIGRAFGVGMEGAVELYRLITTGSEEPQKTFEDFVTDIIHHAAQIKALPGVLLRDFREAQDAIAQFGARGIQVFKDASIMANRFGFETKKIFEMVRGFDTFQQASSNVNQLNAMFGTALSSFELMMEQDPTKRLEMVRSAIMDMGLQWDQMTRFQRMQLAQTLNMAEAELSRVFREGVSFDELERERRRREKEQQKNQELQLNNQKLLNEFLTRTTSIFRDWSFWIEHIKDTLSKALGPIFKVIHDIVDDIGNSLDGWLQDLTQSTEFQNELKLIASDIWNFWVDIREEIKNTNWSEVSKNARDLWEVTKDTLNLFRDFFNLIKENKDLIKFTITSSIYSASIHMQLLTRLTREFVEFMKMVRIVWNNLPEPIRSFGIGGMLQHERSEERNPAGLNNNGSVEEQAVQNIIKTERPNIIAHSTGLGSLYDKTARTASKLYVLNEPEPVGQGFSPRTERTINNNNIRSVNESRVNVENHLTVELDGQQLESIITQRQIRTAIANRRIS